MLAANGIVSLVTDFGEADGFVGQMKGVILGLCPAARMVDVSHAVPPQDIAAGSIVLAGATAAFPAGTVFLAVVDPGVGGDRRGLAVVAGGHAFILPDNGLATPILARGGWRAYELADPRYRRADVSATFHGRDIFAPAAAHLAGGVPPASLGPEVGDPVFREPPDLVVSAGAWEGRVCYIDHFGNAFCEFAQGALDGLGAGVSVAVELPDRPEPVPVVNTYSEVAAGQALALVNSFGFLEIAISCGDAGSSLGLRVGSPVWLRRGSHG